MKNQNQWLAEYAVSHQNPVNQWIHKVCVPAIFLSIVGLLSLVRWPGLESPFASLASLIGIATLAFYFLLGWEAFLLMLAAEAGSLAFFGWLEPRLSFPWAWYLAVFVLAWVGQAVGHAVEGRKPSFFQDLQFLLVGPLWVFFAGRKR